LKVMTVGEGEPPGDPPGFCFCQKFYGKNENGESVNENGDLPSRRRYGKARESG